MNANDLPQDEIAQHLSFSSQEQTPLEASFKKRDNFLDRIFLLGYKNDFKIIVYSALPIVGIFFIFSSYQYIIKIFISLKILSNFSQTLLPIISLFFCGHIGPNELAAATLGGTVIILI